MKLKQIVCIVLVLMLGVCLLTGCGPKESNNKTESNTESNTESSTTPQKVISEDQFNIIKDKYGDVIPDEFFDDIIIESNTPEHDTENAD